MSLLNKTKNLINQYRFELSGDPLGVRNRVYVDLKDLSSLDNPVVGQYKFSGDKMYIYTGKNWVSTTLGPDLD